MRRFNATIALTLLLLAAAVTAALAAVHKPAAARLAAKPPAVTTPPAFDKADLDTTCAPCKDFSQYATGGWQKRNPIPPTQSSWGAFDEVDKRNVETLHAILERIAADHTGKPGSRTQRLGDYFSTCMDSAAAEAAGIQPLQPVLSAIAAMKSPADIARQTGWLHAHAVPATFRLGAGPDSKRSDLTIAIASQGGLSLPDRDYYVAADSELVKVRTKYTAHVSRMLQLLGRRAPDAEAAAVIRIETALARASMTSVQRRDPRATYHKVPLDSLQYWAPAFDWSAYFAVRGMRAPDSVNVNQPEFFRAVSALVRSEPLADWQAYLRYHAIDASAALLSDAFVREDFSAQQILTGVAEREPRWKRCVRASDNDLGDLLGEEFLAERFPPIARERALKLVHNLEAALGERIAALDWMSDTTKAQAKAKLDAFANKIGSPDHPKDYAGVEIGRTSWLDNSSNARSWDIARRIAQIGKPVDKGEWSMTAPTVNAYYSGAFNSINFPAGILQPPFFDWTWDDALIYGAMGVVIGHEMTHGFDDRGRQFDKDGNLRDWWTAADAERYKSRAAKVANQFDSYTVLNGVHVNGKLTLGENIADLGGLAVAYAALEKALGSKPRTRIDGFTPEQRFFLAHARVWHENIRDESMLTLVKSDPHSPAKLRVNGPLSNLGEFAKAFGCKEGDAMVRKQEERARIW